MRDLPTTFIWTLLILACCSSGQAQTDLDPAASLASEAASFFSYATAEAASLYTELTALIGASTTTTPKSTTRHTPTTRSASASTTSRSLTMSTTTRSSHLSSSASHSSSSTQSSSVHESTTRSSSLSTSQISTAAIAATSASASASAQGKSDAKWVAIIVGSVLAAVALLLLTLLCLLCLRRRRKTREGGVTPTSQEIANWKLKHGDTAYAPVTDFDHRGDMGLEKGGAMASERSIPSMHGGNHHSFAPVPPLPHSTSSNVYGGGRTGTDPRSDGIHPAYQAYTPRDAVRDRTRSALAKEMGLGVGAAATDRAAAGRMRREKSVELPTEISPKKNLYNLPRKPIATAVPRNDISTEAALLHKSRSSAGRRSHDSSHPVSPISPDLAELPSAPFGQRSGHGRNDSRDALLADMDDQPSSSPRPSVHCDDSYKIEIPSPQRNSPYQAYQPGVSSSPHGPSHPAAAVIAAFRNQDRDAPEIPRRSPARRSSDSISTDGYRRGSGHDGETDDIPVMWRKSVEQPRMPPKGVTYHDFVPIRRDERRSTPPAAATGAVRGKQDIRRVSLNDLIEAERRKEERRRLASRSYDGVGPNYEEYVVGQAL